MVQMEQAGVPTAVILSEGFQRDADASARAFGMHAIPRVVVPKVYNNVSTEEAYAQTEPVVPELMKLLTTQVSGEDIEAAVLAESQKQSETFEETDQMAAFEAFNAAFLDRDWGDGFPLIPPTAERVERMLAGTTAGRDDVVCMLPPGNGIVTVQKIATNCVMAGCRPEHLPVVMAACRAISNMDEQVVRGLLMSTSAGAPLILVNGPIREEIGVNSKRAALGPGKLSQVNVVIGRAFTLTLKNCGAWYPGVLDMDTIGTPRKFSLCVAENEEDTPWEPWHVEQGFRPEQSTVTIFGTAGDQDIGDQGNTTGDGLLRTIAYASIYGGSGYLASLHGERSTSEGGSTLVFIAPAHARPMAESGYSKFAAKEFLHQHAKLPARYMINNFQVPEKIPYQWRWLWELPPYEQERVMLHVRHDAGKYHIVCVGANDRAKDMVFPSDQPSIVEITDRA